jgi:hypothetical protein
LDKRSAGQAGWSHAAELATYGTGPDGKSGYGSVNLTLLSGNLTLVPVRGPSDQASIVLLQFFLNPGKHSGWDSKYPVGSFAFSAIGWWSQVNDASLVLNLASDFIGWTLPSLGNVGYGEMNFCCLHSSQYWESQNNLKQSLVTFV